MSSLRATCEGCIYIRKRCRIVLNHLTIHSTPLTTFAYNTKLDEGDFVQAIKIRLMDLLI